MTSRSLAGVALAAGATAAIVDVAGSLLHRPAALADPGVVLVLVAAGIVVGVPLALLATAVAAAVARRVGVDADRAVVGAAAGLVALAAVHAPLASLRRLPPPEAVPLGAIVLAAAAVATAAAARRAHSAWLPTVAVAAPVVALLSAVLLHVERLGGAAVVSVRMVALVAGWALAVASAVALARRAARGRGVWMAPGAVALLLALAGAAVAARPATRPVAAGRAGPPAIPGVVLVTVDTLRADAVSAYGGDAPATPSFDALAADGVLFETARSPAPWTKPAVASLHTGLSPWVHHVVGRESRLPGQAVTLAERFAGAGYRTAAIGSNVFLAATGNFAQGFERYRFFPRTTGVSLAAGLLDRAGALRRDAGTDDLTEMAVSWLRTHGDEPFFLWLHYFDPHVPYEPPRELLRGEEPPPRIGWRFDDVPRVRGGYLVPTRDERRWLRRLYDAEVRHVDAAFGRLMASLDAMGLSDSTLVLLTSDHGEEFWEHGGFEHGHTVFGEQLRVPLIVRPPGGTAGRRVAAPVSTESVYATLLDLAGIEYDPSLLDGPSLAGTIGGGAPPPRRAHYATGTLYRGDASAVVDDGLKYIQRRLDGSERLFDLRADPGESSPIGWDARDAVREFRERLAERRREAAARRERLGFPARASGRLDESTLDELRSLGYVQ